ncbi:hypothetical protein BS47DRAFT_1397723 [Hydnum rufescens UP504]|uniref:Uncharacterized protein n=1 Tax=Hydnum rufescens UP504 TaxID=1448309 RepID=A0A9P6AMG1_9AGAM|nr:hypothetical protein BS47DRAFT_1397723 [Hydnum rufescens UP504]
MVSQAKCHLQDASNILAFHLKEPASAQRNYAAIEGIHGPLGIPPDTDFGLAQLVTKEAQALHCYGANLLEVIPGTNGINQRLTLGLETTWTPEAVVWYEFSPCQLSTEPQEVGLSTRKDPVVAPKGIPTEPGIYRHDTT